MQATLDRYATAYSTENLKTLDSMFAQDFTRRPGAEQDEDRSAALKTYRDQFSGLRAPNYELGPITARDDSDGTWADTTYVVEDGGELESAGSISFHLLPEGDNFLIIDRLEVSPTPTDPDTERSLEPITVSDSGAIGDKLELGASTRDDVTTEFGKPYGARSFQSTATGAGSARPASTLEYRCGEKITVADCRTTFFLDEEDGIVTDIETSSPQFTTERGTRPGITMDEAKRREGTNQQGCPEGIAFETSSLSATILPDGKAVGFLLFQDNGQSVITC